MKGTVKEINSERGMVAVLTEHGDFSIFELLGGDALDIGDEVSWKNDMALGSEVLMNHTQGERFEVYFQNQGVNAGQLKRLLLYSS